MDISIYLLCNIVLRRFKFLLQPVNYTKNEKNILNKISLLLLVCFTAVGCSFPRDVDPPINYDFFIEFVDQDGNNLASGLKIAPNKGDSLCFRVVDEEYLLKFNFNNNDKELDGLLFIYKHDNKDLLSFGAGASREVAPTMFKHRFSCLQIFGRLGMHTIVSHWDYPQEKYHPRLLYIEFDDKKFDVVGFDQTFMSSIVRVVVDRTKE